jgi:hypothetical protein
MRVNVDDVAFSDPRFKLLAGGLGMTWQEALGRCLPVWALAYARRSPVLRAGDVDALAERPGFAAAMVGAELASNEPNGVYLCGITERIDFLLLQDAKREQARQARARAAGVKLPPGRSRGKAPGTSPGEVPRDAPGTTHDTATANVESAAESSPGAPTSSEVPGEGAAGRSPGTVPRDVPGEGPYSPDLAPDLTLAPDLALAPAPARAIPPSTEYDADSATDRAALAHRTYERVSSARIAIAAELGMPEQLPFPVITPSTRPLPFSQLLDRIREEGAQAPRVCDVVVNALVEQARDELSLEWLSLKAFSSGAWTTARSRVRGQPADRRGPRSRDPTVGRVEPSKPEEYPTGDQKL